MGCGTSQQQQQDTTTDVKQQRDIKVDPYEYIFYGLYPPEIASGYLINYCIERQFKSKQKQDSQQKQLEKMFLPFTEIESDYEQLVQTIQTERNTFSTEVDQFLKKLQESDDNSLQLKYEQIKKEQEAKEAMKALEGVKPKVMKEEEMVLPPSKAPDFLQKFTPAPGMYKVSFSEMFQVLKDALPYLQEFDLYQVLCYLSFDEARGDTNIANNQQKYQNLRKSNVRAFGHETFRGIFNVVQPQNFARININNVNIFYYFTEIYCNEYADVVYLEVLLKRHFGAQHHQLIENSLSKFRQNWFINKQEFANLMKTQLQSLQSADKCRIQTQNYGVNLKLFYQQQKDKFKEQGTFLDDQLERFEKQINKHRKEVALSILDNKSQQEVLDYDEGKEHKYHATKDMP